MSEREHELPIGGPIPPDELDDDATPTLAELRHADTGRSPGEDGDEPEDEIEDDELPTPATDIAAHEEAAERELVAAHRTYLQAIFDHFGPDEPVFPCAVCKSLGYLHAGMVDDPEVERCTACNGLGVTATGSIVEGNQTRPCPRCRGAGFVPTIAAGPLPPPEPVPPALGILPPSAFPLTPTAEYAGSVA